MRQKSSCIVVVLFVSLFFYSCAKEGMPQGGPIDYTPPEIVLTFPPSNSTEVKPDIDIEIHFSKVMNKDKTTSSIFISPRIGENLEYKWKGKKLTIKTNGLLQENKTYVVTVGMGASDIHNNHLVKSYSFAFSTGKSLDQGEIYGRVFSKGNSSIWAYSLNDTQEPNPSTDTPEYITQSDNKGDYRLQYLSLGKYRLFAVQDVNSDLNWDVDDEPIGVGTRDVELTSEENKMGSINFVIAKRDSTEVKLLNCQLLDKTKLQLEFNKDPDTNSLFDSRNYKIISEMDSSELAKIDKIYLPAGQMRKPCLLLEGLKPQESYKLTITNLTDLWSNKLDSASNSCVFVGTSKLDTIPPSVFVTSPKNKEIAVPLDAEIKFSFTEPMNAKSVEDGFFLEDSSGVKIGGNMKWLGSTDLVFVPKDSLRGSSTYRAGLDGNNVFDLAGNHMLDTSFKILFTTVNLDTLGQLSGKIEVSDTSYRDIIVTAIQSGNGLTGDYRKTLKISGQYRFNNLLPGKYLISAFLDLNRNGKLDLGNPFPFVPAEPQVVYPDIITVRSRWETEGINLTF
ncbi:MAG: Ig-like domain-containing protein [candidate division Zixibacteria bacterium]|nr:Ig-like domain-containing protein [candidate division Zixibacteria bacterium]